MVHLYYTKRVGCNSLFINKIRTMPKDARSVGTHLIKDIKLSSFGYFKKNKN